MSLTVLGIAALHGLPVLAIALVRQSRGLTWLVAILAGAIGVLTGNPAYMAVDLMSVGLGLWAGLTVIPRKTSAPIVVSPPPQEYAAPKPSSNWMRWVAATWLAIILLIVGIVISNNSRVTPPTSNAQNQLPIPTQPTQQYPSDNSGHQSNRNNSQNATKQQNVRSNQNQSRNDSTSTMDELRKACKPPECRVVQ